MQSKQTLSITLETMLAGKKRHHFINKEGQTDDINMVNKQLGDTSTSMTRFDTLVYEYKGGTKPYVSEG